MTDVLGKSCNKVFDVSSFVTSNEICDSIRKQWIHYQLDEITEYFYLKTKDGLRSKGQTDDSYWKEALGQCEIDD